MGSRQIVSILTRPCDRARLTEALADIPPHQSFNPHPAMRPGATGARRPSVTSSDRFQSSPGHATGHDVVPSVLVGSPPTFQSSPGHATGRDFLQWERNTRLATFQSSPGHATGRDGHREAAPALCASFNPHPAMRPGATCVLAVVVDVGVIVSILTRPCDRARRTERRRSWVTPPRFNPHPAMRPGATTGEPGDRSVHPVSILTRPCDRARR